MHECNDARMEEEIIIEIQGKTGVSL